MDAVVSGIAVEALVYDRDSTTVRTQFDQETTPASLAVIATLSEVTDADPVDLDPLQYTVDPDALDAIARAHTGTEGDVQVTFTHEDHLITVSSAGVVTVMPDTDLHRRPTGGPSGR